MKIMNNFYNKIYNAVNEGIQKALLVDNQKDVSINYAYNKINNNIDPLLYEFVDLGLNVKWCSHNLGAACIDTSVFSWYGDYYAWGETETKYKQGYSSDNYNYAGNKQKLNYNIVNISYSDKKSLIAKKVYMPTDEDCQILINNCRNKWVTDYNDITGLNGRLFISDVNGNSIFIPAGGDYENKKIYGDGSQCFIYTSTGRLKPNTLYCTSGSAKIIQWEYQWAGCNIRPVCAY